jgi:hypothetical protein
VQGDHIGIAEEDFKGWIAGRFQVRKRAWIQGDAFHPYLTFELSKIGQRKGTDHRKRPG